VLRAPPVSWLTICPLGQPEKAIGLEPQIELWLAFLLPPYCLSHQKPKASSRQQHASAKKENPKRRSTLHGLENRAQIFAPSSRRRVFSLDSPLYRTRLPEMWVLGRFSDLAATEKVFYKGRPATWSTTVRSRSVAGPGELRHPWVHLQTIFPWRPCLSKIVRSLVNALSYKWLIVPKRTAKRQIRA